MPHERMKVGRIDDPIWQEPITPVERRRIGLLPIACGVVLASLAVSTGCTSRRPARTQSPGSPTSASASLLLPTACALCGRNATNGVLVRGNATVDGTPFDARWVGAVVLRAGLVTPCQYTLPPVANGRYVITVLAATESSGCGAPGAQIALWTFAHNEILYSTNALAWPGNGRATTFTARYSTSTPAGVVPAIAQFTGGVVGRDGQRLPPGTRVEAYIGGTRCGVASVRSTSDFFGYILAVVGPDSIAGCTRDAALTFRIDGSPAAHTSVVNTPPGQHDRLDLALPP